MLFTSQIILAEKFFAHLNWVLKYILKCLWNYKNWFHSCYEYKSISQSTLKMNSQSQNVINILHLKYKNILENILELGSNVRSFFSARMICDVNNILLSNYESGVCCCRSRWYWWWRRIGFCFKFWFLFGSGRRIKNLLLRTPFFVADTFFSNF